jgi:guanylate kinase
MYQLQEQEMIFVFTGPDGSGRKTVADMVGTTLGLSKVLSYTTRNSRATELDGQDYHFITREQFMEAQQSGEFIESVEIDGNFYGIKSKDIEDMFRTNGFIYLILNAYGANVLKKLYGDKVTRIFIYVDRATIIERQISLGASEDIIRAHTRHYEEDMAYQRECKHSVENLDLAHTVFAVSNILDLYMNRNLVDKD